MGLVRACVDVVVDDGLGVQPQRGVRVHADQDGAHEGVDLVARIAAPRRQWLLGVRDGLGAGVC
eukprot:502949-Prorocentrum_minimum.AAC.1